MSNGLDQDQNRSSVGPVSSCLQRLSAGDKSRCKQGKYTFKKNISVILSVSNCLDPDQERPSVCPDLCPNCLQRISADDKICHRQVKRKVWQRIYMYELLSNHGTVKPV